MTDNKEELCPNCGEPGKHYIEESNFMGGFWTCNKYYGPDGIRLKEHTIITDNLFQANILNIMFGFNNDKTNR